MVDFAGIIRFTYNGTPITVAAKVEYEPSDFTYTVEHNQNGSFCRYVQPNGPTFDIEFRNTIDNVTATSLPWNDIMQGGPYQIALINETTKRTKIWSNAQFIGRPKIDDLKGMVSGITGQCPVGNFIETSA